MDNKSPITKQLLLDYPNIKHELQSLEKDIASLIYAYNLVNAFSSFSQVAISFNDNLINLFEYEIYKVNSFILHFHYDIDKLNKTFNIYRMKPSEDYFSDMYNWRNTESQREMLLKIIVNMVLEKQNIIKPFLNNLINIYYRTHKIFKIINV